MRVSTVPDAVRFLRVTIGVSCLSSLRIPGNSQIPDDIPFGQEFLANTLSA